MDIIKYICSLVVNLLCMEVRGIDVCLVYLLVNVCMCIMYELVYILKFIWVWYNECVYKIYVFIFFLNIKMLF